MQYGIPEANKKILISRYNEYSRIFFQFLNTCNTDAYDTTETQNTFEAQLTMPLQKLITN